MVSRLAPDTVYADLVLQENFLDQQLRLALGIELLFMCTTTSLMKAFPYTGTVCK